MVIMHTRLLSHVNKVHSNGLVQFVLMLSLAKARPTMLCIHLVVSYPAELERKARLGTLGNILGLQLAVRVRMECNTHVTSSNAQTLWGEPSRVQQTTYLK